MKKAEYLKMLQQDAAAKKNKGCDDAVIGMLGEIFELVGNVDIDGTKTAENVYDAIRSQARKNMKDGCGVFGKTVENCNAVLNFLGVKDTIVDMDNHCHSLSALGAMADDDVIDLADLI